MTARERTCPVRCLLLLGLALMQAGCSTFSEDGGFGLVEARTKEAIGADARWLTDDAQRGEALARVRELLSAELSAASAMQIALLANPELQAEYANLGISEADLVQAGRLPNPGFSFSKTTGGGAQEIERGLHFSVMSLLTMPLRLEIETRRFESARLAAAAASLRIAMEARSAFFEAVAARQTTAYFQQVLESAQASRELMSRMSRVGNSSRLDLAREQLFHAEASASLARAVKQEDAAREALIRALGLWGADIALELPERLPDLPAAPVLIDDVEQVAMTQRLDILAARDELASRSGNLDLTRATRFISVFEIGPAQVRERGEAIRDGYEINLEIPIFDWGDARIGKAEALYNQSAERLRAAAVNARSEVRQAYRAYRTAHDVARHYRDEIVPLRKRISDEQLLRYNGMLIGVFELIADAREQVTTVSGYLDALRDFWIADTALESAMLGTGSSPVAGTAAATPVAGGGEAH